MADAEKSNLAEPKFYSEKELESFNKKILITKLLELQNYQLAVNKRFDEVNARFKILTTEIETLKAKPATSAPSNDENERVINVEKEVAAMQQYSRRDSAELVGMPASIENKDLEGKAIDLLAAIGVSVKADDLQACHRLFKKDRVILKFINRKFALSCLRSRSKLKSIDFKALGLPEDSKIYLNESLCPEYKRLFGKCHALFKEGKIKNCWTFNGTVRIRLNNDDEHSLFHNSELKALSL